MIIEVGVAGAFLGGLLALISPCSALLLPSFFAYAFGSWRSLMLRTAVFTLGLAAVLVPLGAGVGAIGSLLTRYRTQVTTVGGVVMIVLGVAIVFGFGFGIAGVSTRMSKMKISTTASVFLLGALYGLAGFCAGPLLGGVLTIAATGGSAWYGGLLMAVYAIGMAAPLFILSLLWDRLRLRERSWLRGRAITVGPIHTHSTSLISGVLFIGIGLLFLLTDGTASVGSIVGVDTEFKMQLWVRKIAGTVTDTGFLLGVVLIVLTGLLIRIAVLSRRDRSGDAAPADAPHEEMEPSS